VILDQQDQRHLSLIGAVWAKTVAIGEVLFLIGAMLILVHFCAFVVALIGTISKRYAPPSWIWIELQVLVYFLAPIMWFRLLFVICTHNQRLSQMESYLYIFFASLGAFVLAALNLSTTTWYANAAFPLLGIGYAFQFVLDARLPGKRKKSRQLRSPSRSRPIATAPAANRFHVRPRQAQMAYSLQGIARPFKRSTPAEFHTPTPRVQSVGIWHSPADAKFAAKLRIHLQPKIREGAIGLWDAGQILPGAAWEEERSRAVQSAGVAVVLVSAELMACDLIAGRELPQLLYRAMAQGTIILLLHVSPCNFEGSGLERFHPVNSPDRPLAKLERSDRDRILAEAARAICQRLGLSL